MTIKDDHLVESLPVKRDSSEEAKLTIEWNSGALTWQAHKQVSISLYGYQEKENVYPKY